MTPEEDNINKIGTLIRLLNSTIYHDKIRDDLFTHVTTNLKKAVETCKNEEFKKKLAQVQQNFHDSNQNLTIVPFSLGETKKDEATVKDKSKHEEEIIKTLNTLKIHSKQRLNDTVVALKDYIKNGINDSQISEKQKLILHKALNLNPNQMSASINDLMEKATYKPAKLMFMAIQNRILEYEFYEHFYPIINIHKETEYKEIIKYYLEEHEGLEKRVSNLGAEARRDAEQVIKAMTAIVELYREMLKKQ